MKMIRFSIIIALLCAIAVGYVVFQSHSQSEINKQAALIRMYGSESEAQIALQKNPNDVVALRTMAMKSGAKGKWRDACDYYSRDLVQEPGNRNTKYGYAIALFCVGSEDQKNMSMKIKAKQLFVSLIAGNDDVGISARKMLQKPEWSSVPDK